MIRVAAVCTHTTLQIHTEWAERLLRMPAVIFPGLSLSHATSIPYTGYQGSFQILDKKRKKIDKKKKKIVYG